LISIAHEVNQPLSGIITNASTSLLMLADDPPDIDGALESAQRTIRDASRASEVISRLRALFKKTSTASESLDLNEATREVLALSVSELQRAQVIRADGVGGRPAPCEGRPRAASTSGPQPGLERGEVAERVGYGSASTFSTAFSRHMGRPPGRYAREGSQHDTIHRDLVSRPSEPRL